ncbi:MAG: glycosyltransferase family 4 protein [Fibrobacteres bacterium]|nr:glycosyltransferase family 4 protein [Fibrobacterota bacterium]
MRIAQVSPLYESVPPRLYGGTERIVHYLTEALVAMGHEVTLFASGDSRTSARLVACCGEALRLGGCQDPIAPQLAMAEEVMRHADDFDILHSHIDYLAFPAARRRPDAPLITTLHGRTDHPENSLIHREFAGMRLISISREQRRFLPDATWLGTVQHGLPADLYPFQGKAGKYLAFLGRISPEKRPDLAIEIARKTGIPLKIAAKVSRHEEDYFEDVIKPLLAPPEIEFVGEIGEAEKAGFLGGAMALLFPVDWPEPFGLVMIEAMACGTPVIAFRRGSVPEVIDEGVSGFIVENTEAAAGAVAKASGLDRARVRAAFEQRFTTERMAAGYLRLYKRLLASRPEPVPQGGPYAREHDRSGRLFHSGRGIPGREAEPGP